MNNPTNKPDYLLLTPGPLSTSRSVRAAMAYDSCTWDEDYKQIVSDIRSRLLHIANCSPQLYTSVLMQGSGTFGVESALGSSINPTHHKVLILANGVYGRRMCQIATVLQLPHCIYEVPEHLPFDSNAVRTLLEEDNRITHIAMAHCETTTGMLNDLTMIGNLAKQYQKQFIVDAMSSFGGIAFSIEALNIAFLISSANKCIQGCPGFSFIICKKSALLACQGQAKSLSLDLYGQWQTMEEDPGKWRYTSPTHVVLAFHQALKEFAMEGGTEIRAQRYAKNQSLLVEGMSKIGFQAYIARELQSPIITTFIEPIHAPQTQTPFVFAEFYQFLKSRGFVIYPGKVTSRNTFRVGSIGHLFAEDVQRFLHEVDQFVKNKLQYENLLTQAG